MIKRRRDDERIQSEDRHHNVEETRNTLNDGADNSETGSNLETLYASDINAWYRDPLGRFIVRVERGEGEKERWNSIAFRGQNR